ncbi:MAG: hypothetical protein BGO98_37155 [Myxococcales bacterium 68-20]|nr:hypothetical protein [Myxococcales bacterium]OJY22223.1 MAG: hypothetical protein BGO98_37155 [Myxococcales bacterium 68-20]
MKRSLARTSALALAFASLGGLCASACADSEVAPPMSSHVDAGDAASPNNTSDAAESMPEASIDAGPRVCSYHGFCPTTLPAAQTLVSVWGDGTGVAWAVSTEGNVLRWDGSQWMVHASKLGPLAAVWGSGPTDVWIGGENGLHHGTGSSSAALTFTTVRLADTPTRIASIWGLSSSDIWAVGTMDDPDTGRLVGGAFHFTAGSWALVPVSSEIGAYSHVWGSAGSGVWLAGQRPMPDAPWLMELVVLRKSGGDDFTDIALPADPHIPPPIGAPGSLRGGAAVSDTSIWLHGASAGSWPITWRGTSTDNGKTFTFTAERDGTPNAPQINALFGTSANDVWTVGDYGQVRHWNGTKWAGTAITTTDLPVINPFFAVWARPSSEVWLVGKDIALRYDPAHEKDGGVQ